MCFFCCKYLGTRYVANTKLCNTCRNQTQVTLRPFFNNFYSRLCTYLIFQKYVQNLHSLSSCVNCHCLAKIIKCSFIYLIYLYKETFKVYKSCKLLTWITISSAEFEFRNANTAALPFV